MKNAVNRCLSPIPFRVIFAAVMFFGITSMVHAENVVKWPGLKKLDDLAEKCEALSEAKDLAELRKIAPDVKKAAAIVQSDKVPENARDAEKVRILQGDLKSLSDAIGDPGTQDGEELTALLAAVHPVVEQLMEASGMPHVHEEGQGKPKGEVPK